MFLRKSILKLLLLPVLASPLAALADPVYTMTFLPADFYAEGMNNSGHVVGTSGGGAAIWNGSSVFSLGGVLPGSEGLAINNLDQIAGRNGSIGFVYAGGIVTNLSATAFSWTRPTGINDAGVITGTLGDDVAGNQTGFIYSGTFFTDIDPGATSQGNFANAINNAGQVTGTWNTGGPGYNPDRHAFLYDAGTVLNLGSLGGRVGEGNDLNDAGQVVGWADNYEGTEELAFFYSAGLGMTDIGGLGGRSSRANGINNGALVVGMSDVGGSDFFDYHAFLYDQHSLVDLNTLVTPVSGWRLVSAEDINDAGQILAQACMTSGECVAVRLDLVSAIPEPASWGMLLGGLALVAARALRRRRQWTRLLALPLLASPLAAMAVPTYTATFAPTGFMASKMNNAGQVVGGFGGAAAIWSGTTVTDIGALAPDSVGYAINNRGHIGGGLFPTAYETAFIYTPAGVRDIGRQGQWGLSWVRGLNDAGQVAGIGKRVPPGEAVRGFFYSNGVIRMIGSFGGDSSVTNAINNRGQVVGYAELSDSQFGDLHIHAFLYRDRVQRDLGTLGGRNSDALDINDAGQIVGESTTASGETHPFLYESGVMADLGTLGGGFGSAVAINNPGAIVGATGTGAFFYEAGVMTDLNTRVTLPTGWVLQSGIDINDSGQILAFACRMEDCTHVRLDPVP